MTTLMPSEIPSPDSSRAGGARPALSRLAGEDILAWARVWCGPQAGSVKPRDAAKLVWNHPGLRAPLRALLLGAATLAYREHRAGAAFAALSVIYNLRYIEGAQSEIGVQSEIGARAEMRRLVLSRVAARPCEEDGAEEGGGTPPLHGPANIP